MSQSAALPAAASLPDVDPREFAVSTRGLRKTYRSLKGTQVAVSHLDLDVPVGGVHGFLGPNGSGKTTTIRMLLGLIRADSGIMHLFGDPTPAHLPKIIDRVGAVVEQPKFFPNFTARRNLELLVGAVNAPKSAVGRFSRTLG